MTRHSLFHYTTTKYNISPDSPWSDTSAVLRRSSNRKWYGLVMEVGYDKLGLSGDEQVDVFTVKCDRIPGSFLRTQGGFHPVYHMNKDKWIAIRLDGSVPDDEIKNLIDLSYQLTADIKKNRNPRP